MKGTKPFKKRKKRKKMKQFQKASSQTNDSGIHFDEQTIRSFCFGAFEIIDSAITLLDTRAQSVAEKQEANTMVPINDHLSLLGILGSFLILLGHTTELLLKFNLQLDGCEIPKKHDLYTLFNKLSDNSKKRIESGYKRLKDRKHPLETQWTSVDTLFKSHPEYHVDWRYVVETNAGTLNAPFAFLRLAAESLYRCAGF